MSRDVIADINVRGDDHRDPLPELAQLLAIHRCDVEPRRHWFANPSGYTDFDAMDAEWRKRGLDPRFRR